MNTPIEKYDLKQIKLEDLAELFNDKLKNHFDDLKVSVEDCPDLTKAPFNLAASGFGGKTAIADVGGVLNLAPLPNKDKIYSFEQVANLVNIGNEECFITGAAAGPFKHVGQNCELIPNVLLKKDGEHFKISKDLTHYAEITKDEKYILGNSNFGEFSLLGTMFVSEGKPGKVLKIEAIKRKGKDNCLTTILREILKAKYDKDPVSLGGVFLIEKGKAMLHIMPEFSKVPLMNEDAVNKWLKFFEMNAPLVCLTTMTSVDPDLNLYIEHTHCFSDHNQGGHYHFDTTPDEIKYVAYLNVAQCIYRIDKTPKIPQKQ